MKNVDKIVGKVEFTNVEEIKALEKFASKEEVLGALNFLSSESVTSEDLKSFSLSLLNQGIDKYFNGDRRIVFDDYWRVVNKKIVSPGNSNSILDGTGWRKGYISKAYF